MLVSVLVFFSVFYSENYAEPITSVREIELPSSKSVKIFEDETSWDDRDRRIIKIPNRFNQASSTKRADSTSGEADSEENFNQHALEKFLNSYAERFRRKQSLMNTKYENNKEPIDSEEADETSSSTEKVDKSKHWNSMHAQHHKHPFEDKSGWVSLDPVPWSLSKISKWHSEKKPANKPDMSHGGIEKPWEADLVTSEYDDVPSKPSWHQNPRPHKPKPFAQYKPVQVHAYNDEDFEQDNYYQMKKPTIVIQQPEIVEAGSSIDHKVQIHYDMDQAYEDHKHFIKKPSHHNTHRYDVQTHKNCDHDHSSEEIITDGELPNFPNRRKSTEIPKNHPFAGNGDWILLSTTKGYKSPHNRQRSLHITSNPMQIMSGSTKKSIQIFPNSIPYHHNTMILKQGGEQTTSLDQKEPDSVGVKKGVQLTVLPPLKSSKINMTTSHGGLLQVESTFETVEQAQQRRARKLKENYRKKPVRQKVGKKVIRRPVMQKLNLALPVTSLNERMGRPDISAVLAAAGAGMIPATMAMLVPMAMGGKRRRRDTRPHFRSFSSQFGTNV